MVLLCHAGLIQLVLGIRIELWPRWHPQLQLLQLQTMQYLNESGHGHGYLLPHVKPLLEIDFEHYSMQPLQGLK